ncbi:ANTAR domain-containing protein [Rhodococcus sp. WS4]|nr:ANTAR domain-containing protein [Rhodococcus sp. WS4]
MLACSVRRSRAICSISARNRASKSPLPTVPETSHALVPIPPSFGVDYVYKFDLHSSQRYAFDEASISVGATLATHAAIALIASQREEQFRDALASRDLIGQAKGMLMQRYSVDAGEAFTMLTEQSQHANEPVNEVAWKIVERGLPE